MPFLIVSIDKKIITRTYLTFLQNMLSNNTTVVRPSPRIIGNQYHVAPLLFQKYLPLTHNDICPAENEETTFSRLFNQQSYTFNTSRYKKQSHRHNNGRVLTIGTIPHICPHTYIVILYKKKQNHPINFSSTGANLEYSSRNYQHCQHCGGDHRRLTSCNIN